MSCGVLKQVLAVVAPPMLSHDGGVTFVLPCPPGNHYTDASAYPAPSRPLTFLFVDESLVVVDKPAFLPSENTRHLKDSVRSRVEAELRSRGESVAELHIVHRLDWETSGVLVLARTAVAMRSLSMQFAARSVKKVYIADIVGPGGPRGACGHVSLPLSPDPDRRPLQRVDFRTGREASTSWHVVDSLHGAWRLRLQPASGRRHQLRMHMLAAFGCRIAGDALYSPRPCAGQAAGARTERQSCVQLTSTATSASSVRVRLRVAAAALNGGSDRLHLHATELAFVHPTSGERMAFTSEPPFELRTCLTPTGNIGEARAERRGVHFPLFWDKSPGAGRDYVGDMST